MSDAREFKTSLVKYQDSYLHMVQQQFADHRLVIDEYQMTCARNALAIIDETLRNKGISFQDPQLDQSSLTMILQQVTTLRLNASAMPREVYFTLRNVRVGSGWGKKLEMGVEGDGNDALLRNFGVNVDKVANPWLVREKDEFEYPAFDGFDASPPKWRPQGSGKVVRVVYPIRLKDGSTEFLIQERDDVLPNLSAHIRNNLMNETFGIAENRFKANAEQLKKIEAKKAELLSLLKGKSLDELIEEPLLDAYISPAWKDNAESMIIRKMRNNAVKKYPKDFGSAFAATQYAQTDETYSDMRDEVRSEPKEVFDVVEIEEEADPVAIPATTAPEPPQEAKPAKQKKETAARQRTAPEPEPVLVQESLADFTDELEPPF